MGIDSVAGYDNFVNKVAPKSLKFDYSSDNIIAKLPSCMSKKC